MKLSVGLLCLIVGSVNSASDSCGIQSTSHKITNGNKAAIDEYPWMALLGFITPGRSTIFWGCSGSLIGRRSILTAAHCVDDLAIKTIGELRTIRLGETDLQNNPDCYSIENGDKDCADQPIDFSYTEIKIHPERNSQTRINDIALIILSMDPPLSDFIYPICLPSSVTVPNLEHPKAKYFVAGWGWVIQSVSSTTKLHINVPLVTNEQCRIDFSNSAIDDEHYVCAGGRDKQNACKGDSGGPLMYTENGQKWTLVGIVSFGPAACANGKPTVFVKVSQYLPWINSVIR